MKRRKFDVKELDFFYDDGLYIPTRTIYIGSTPFDPDNEVDSYLSARVLKSIHVLEMLNKKEDINIILNTPGGDEYNGLAIYDMLCSTSCKINIKVYGEASSMGSIILQAGNKRLLSANALILIHDGSFGYEGEAKNFEKWGEESKRLRMLMYKIYYKRMKEKNSKITLEKIEEYCKSDYFLTAKKAIDLGLADEIIKEKISRKRK